MLSLLKQTAIHKFEGIVKDWFTKLHHPQHQDQVRGGKRIMIYTYEFLQG